MIQEKKQVNLALYQTTIDIGAPFLKQVAWYFVNVLFFKNPFITSSFFKRALLRLFGAAIGNGVVIKPCVNIKYPWKLRVGNYTWIGENVWIDNLSDITVGNNVVLSQGCLLLTGSHNYRNETFDFLSAPIILEDGVWICAKATVPGGIVCRSHSILTAGSVPDKELEPYTIYKGNPAAAIRTRTIG